MKYEKAMAEVIAFDNSDVITGSGSCGHKTSGNSCKNGTQDFDQCYSLNHKDKPKVEAEYFNEMNKASWLD